MTEQLEIEGIGQQLASLTKWKETHGVYTHESWAVPDDCKPWNSWAGNPNPIDHLANKGDGAFGFGETEKEAILDLCQKIDMAPPFWWKE